MFIWHSFCPWMFWSICWHINLYFLGHFFKDGYISSHICSCLLHFHLSRQRKSKAINCFRFTWPRWSVIFTICADNHIRKLLFPSFLLALIMHSYLKIQHGRQRNYIVHTCTFLLPQQDLFKKTVSNVTFLNCPWVTNLLYFFRKDKQRKFIFLLSLSLDLINIISLPYLASWSNASSWQNLAEKPANFAGCRLLYTTLDFCSY